MSGDDLCRILSSADLGPTQTQVRLIRWTNNRAPVKTTKNKIMEYLFFGLPVVGHGLTENRVSAGGPALFEP